MLINISGELKAICCIGLIGALITSVLTIIYGFGKVTEKLTEISASLKSINKILNDILLKSKDNNRNSVSTFITLD